MKNILHWFHFDRVFKGDQLCFSLFVIKHVKMVSDHIKHGKGPK